MSDDEHGDPQTERQTRERRRHVRIRQQRIGELAHYFEQGLVRASAPTKKHRCAGVFYWNMFVEGLHIGVSFIRAGTHPHVAMSKAKKKLRME